MNEQDIVILANAIGWEPQDLYLYLQSTERETGDKNTMGTLYNKQRGALDDPGMMMGAGEFDPTTLMPVEDKRESFATANELEPFLSLSPTSLEGFLAQSIAGGAAPSEAIEALVETQPDLDPAALERAQEMATDFFGKQAAYTSAVSTWGSYDEQGNPTDKVTMKDSPLAEQYRAEGRALPTERFTAQDYLSDSYGGDKVAEQRSAARYEDDLAELLAIRGEGQTNNRNLRNQRFNDANSENANFELLRDAMKSEPVRTESNGRVIHTPLRASIGANDEQVWDMLNRGDAGDIDGISPNVLSPMVGYMRDRNVRRDARTEAQGAARGRTADRSQRLRRAERQEERSYNKKSGDWANNLIAEATARGSATLAARNGDTPARRQQALREFNIRQAGF